MNYGQQAQQSYQNLQNFQNTMQDPSQMYQQAQQQYQIPQAYQQLQGANQAVAQTNNLIGALPGQVAQTQNGTEMTAAQRGNLMGTELAPLQQQYGAATNSQTAASSNYQALLGQAATQANLGLQGEQLKAANLQSLYGTAAQGQVGMASAAAQGAAAAAAQTAANAQALQANQQVSMLKNFMANTPNWQQVLFGTGANSSQGANNLLQVLQGNGSTLQGGY